MNRKLMIALPLTLFAGAGSMAIAAHHESGHGPMGDKAMTRAEMQQHTAKLWDRLDANKDGKIDAADHEAHKGAKFDKLDTDKDGKISRDEFASAHKGGHDGARGGGAPGGERKAGKGGHHRMGMMMLHMADANKDRIITRAEFDAAAASHFDRADANKDGTITPEERKAAHQKMRETMHGKMGHHG